MQSQHYTLFGLLHLPGHVMMLVKPQNFILLFQDYSRLMEVYSPVFLVCSSSCLNETNVYYTYIFCQFCSVSVSTKIKAQFSTQLVDLREFEV